MPNADTGDIIVMTMNGYIKYFIVLSRWGHKDWQKNRIIFITAVYII
jgi:hypothetical protein